ncbi:MAG: hypothetical protein MK080_09015 [Opitutales bacterium]|nr:hypothetical protein [Opitutales bacterium]NRA26210.1 hypothetical protein [Opitutales bacterium]
MNRSILLVICDFLLLSMLALARFDQSEPVETVIDDNTQVAEESATAELLELLEMSLEETQNNTESLEESLRSRQEELAQQAEALAASQEAITAKEAELEQARALAEQAALARKAAIVEVERAETQLEQSEQIATQLRSELNANQESNLITLERLRQAETSLLDQQEALAELEREKAAMAEREQATRDNLLETQAELRVTAAEKQLLTTNLENTQIQLETAQIEKRQLQKQTERLTENVGALAQSSQQIKEEIQQSQPLSPANIFNRYQENRLALKWSSVFTGVFGTRSRDEETIALRLQTDEGVFALFNAQGTPLDPSSNRGMPLTLELTIESRNGDSYTPTMVEFLVIDPRIIRIRLPDTYAVPRQTGAVRLSPDPFRFDKATLVHPPNGYYGESPYRVSAQTSQVLEMNSRILSSLFGDFDPKRGDMVFSMAGNLNGFMLNERSAVRLESLATRDVLELGKNYSFQRAEMLLNAQKERYRGLPTSLR